MDDGEQSDVARRRGCLDRLGAKALELAAGRAVDDIPSAVAQLEADAVGGVEVPRAAAIDALGEKLLGLFPIRSSWL